MGSAAPASESDREPGRQSPAERGAFQRGLARRRAGSSGTSALEQNKNNGAIDCGRYASRLWKMAFRQWPASSSNAPRTLAPPGNGMPTILTWRRTAPLSVVSSGHMPRPETRLGCGHWHSASMRIEARRTAMLRAGRLRWLHLPRAGDGSDRKLRQLSEQCGQPPHRPIVFAACDPKRT